MTPSFEQQMGRMNGLRFAPAELTTHWEALQDVPYDLLVGAVSHAQRVCQDFPTPHELLTFVDLVKPHLAPTPHEEDRRRKLPKPITITAPWLSKPIIVTDEVVPHCATCADTGWDLQFCGTGRAPADLAHLDRWKCERWIEHYSHEWARKCACFDSNPVIQLKLERQRKYAAERAGKK